MDLNTSPRYLGGTYYPHFFMAGVDGFEPPNAGVKFLCLTAWRYPYIVLSAFIQA